MQILWEDADVLVVCKPPGLLVHRSAASSLREPALLQIMRDLRGMRLYPAHRLDRATSGLVLFAKHPQAAAFLAEQFRNHQVEKAYLALARGWTPDMLSLQQALRDLDREDGPLQEARTELICLKRVRVSIPIDNFPEARYSFVQLNPQTGRRHQLRRHMKQAHHPLIGDTAYGKGIHNRLFRERWDCHRLLLHHWSCRWRNAEGELITVRAPLDEVWRRLGDELGFCEPAVVHFPVFS